VAEIFDSFDAALWGKGLSLPRKTPTGLDNERKVVLFFREAAPQWAKQRAAEVGFSKEV